MESDNNTEKTITKEAISLMEMISFPGRIVVVDTLKDAEKATEYLKTVNCIGFDTETKPAFKKGQLNKVALLQLSTDDICFLFRINIIGFPKPLIEILNDKNILKIGLSIKDDFSSIRRCREFHPNSFIELQDFVKKYAIKEMSLQKIFALLFGKKISKSQRLSNWESDVLSEGQKKYAATDAWACKVIYDYLSKIDPIHQ